MIIETNTELYYAIRNKFLGNNTNWWEVNRGGKFRQMLAEYNAEVNTSRRGGPNYACDFAGISPGVDIIEFRDEKLYTMFLLRWS